MPIHRATGPKGGKGYQYGTTGKVYPTRAGAVRQAQAKIRLGFHHEV